MTETAQANTNSEPTSAGDQKLDDVLLAMDVVDTLRHREQLVARELDEEGREEELLQRLKDIYEAQGIEVPERILKDGVAGPQRTALLLHASKELAVGTSRPYLCFTRSMA